MIGLRTLLRRFRQPTPSVSRPTTGPMAVRDRYEDIRDVLQLPAPTIVDGGANTGTVTDLFLRQYQNPTIHAFEPRPDAADVMREKYRHRENVRVHQNALGARAETRTFNVVGRPTSSSFLAPSAVNRTYHPDLMHVERHIEVSVVRLDRVLECDLDLVKLDLQGYELEALRGCEELLPRIKVITTEVEFVPLYETQPLFADIDLFLRAHGFRLLNLYELWTQEDGQLTAGDAVYLNERHFSALRRS
ncbi:MAG: FkbM family methyltransferase [bacterium]